MKIIINKPEDGTVNAVVEGSIDTLTSQNFENEIEKNIDGAKKLIVDLEKVDYVSSAGLRAFLGLNSKMEVQGEMIIKNVCESVKEVFEMTGFDEILTIQ